MSRITLAERLRRIGWAACIGGSAVLAGQAGWVHAKAVLAQQLLQHSWNQASAAQPAAAPWPGADTHPVARLRMTRLGIDQIVLAGDSGRVLAFGPGWAPSSATPGQHGNVVLSGHRDTHFAWLQQLQAGDVIELDTPAATRRFVIRSHRVADARREQINLGAGDRLTLVTCWPFEAMQSGGPLRYVVSADPLIEGDATLALSAR